MHFVQLKNRKKRVSPAQGAKFERDEWQFWRRRDRGFIYIIIINYIDTQIQIFHHILSMYTSRYCYSPPSPYSHLVAIVAFRSFLPPLGSMWQDVRWPPRGVNIRLSCRMFLLTIHHKKTMWFLWFLCSICPPRTHVFDFAKYLRGFNNGQHDPIVLV